MFTPSRAVLPVQERGDEVRRLVTSAPRQEAEITGFKSELTKKTQSLSAVWDKFASRLTERERALQLAASFYDRVMKVINIRQGFFFSAGENLVLTQTDSNVCTLSLQYRGGANPIWNFPLTPL